MDVEQSIWERDTRLATGPAAVSGSAQLVLAFGAPEALGSPGFFADLRGLYPEAHLVLASTAGEIVGSSVHDGSVVATALHLTSTRVAARSIDLDRSPDSFAAGRALARLLPARDLVHVLLFSDGLQVNGSALAHGMAADLGETVAVTGGLAGDGDRFERTLVSLDEPACPGKVVAVGLYGSRLRVGYGSMGGWDPFGPERLVTRACGNVLHELDGVSALELYRRYLGERAAELPASGLLFPLSVRRAPSEEAVVRTILAIDPESGSLTFAGEVPVGSYARLMKANFDRLIDGAAEAAIACREGLGGAPAQLVLLVSCVGRKLVLRQRVEEEVESVREVLGPSAAMAGFYSYGELCPHMPDTGCELHNQTMTITALSEV
jgi:hypothetical protein